MTTWIFELLDLFGCVVPFETFDGDPVTFGPIEWMRF
jgi:hypothetical protein